MLKEIEVAGGWYRYKTQTPIRPGKYWEFQTRRPDDLTKRRLRVLRRKYPVCSSDGAPFKGGTTWGSLKMM